MQREEPRNLRGLVQTRDMADYMGVPENTIRAWRMRHAAWVTHGRKASNALHTYFPTPVVDPRNPDEPFLINGGAVYDMGDVILFHEKVGKHERKAGNPQWTRPAAEPAAS